MMQGAGRARGVVQAKGVPHPSAGGGAGAAGTTVVDGGGPVIVSAKVYLIFWGTAWSATPAPTPTSQDVESAVQAILSSSFMSGLNQYHFIQNAALQVSSVVNNASSPPTTFSNTDVTNLLTGMFNAGTLPKPATDHELLYVVIMPKGVTFSSAGTIGEHSYFVYGGANAHYAWVMNNGTLSYVTQVFSHELVEACADPEGSGVQLNAAPICTANANNWCEIADVCQGTTATVNGVSVQAYWSQQDNACVLQSSFTPVYAQGAPGNGIGGYDLKSPADLAFAFDYDHSGKVDHMALYRPGTGTMWILKNTAGSFAPVYAQGAPGNGIGGYDLKSPADLAFAFDYDHSGKVDHVALYRPGTGTMWILKNTAGSFAPVYAQGAPGNGIGGYDLKSAADRAFAFDYDSSGKLDHLVLYRPGTGTMWILKNTGGQFTPVYAQGAPGSGIGGYDLKSAADQAFAFDYNSSGKLDHLVLYRPGTGTMWILKNTAGSFAPVYAQGAPGNGIGGYDLKSAADRAFAFDFDRSGKLDHLALYRPGTGTMWILKNTAGSFAPVFHEGASGTGIGGYDLQSAADHAFAFDYSSVDRGDYLALYRPGTGTMWILTRR